MNNLGCASATTLVSYLTFRAGGFFLFLAFRAIEDQTLVWALYRLKNDDEEFQGLFGSESAAEAGKELSSKWRWRSLLVDPPGSATEQLRSLSEVSADHGASWQRNSLG